MLKKPFSAFAVTVVMYFHDKASPGPVPSAEGLEALDVCFAWRRTSKGAAK